MWNLIANSSLKRTIFKRECNWRGFPHLQQYKMPKTSWTGAQKHEQSHTYVHISMGCFQ